MLHNVLFDYTSSGLLRLTCLTCNENLIRQPYMNSKQWKSAYTEFLNKHINPNMLYRLDNNHPL